MEVYSRILNREPDNTDALYYAAVAAAQERKYSESIKLIERALSSGPPQAKLHNLLAEIHVRLGQPQQAIANYDRAIALKPDFADAYGNRANALTDLGRREEALADYDRALALRPNSAEDWSNRGATLHELKRNDEALASYDRAIALRPDFAQTHFNRANVLKDQRQFEAALSGYRRAIELNPALAEAHINHALTLNYFNRHQEALTSIDRARALQPDSLDVCINRGNILRLLGRLDEAKEEYNRALHISPNNSAAHLGIANILLQEGQHSLAKAAAEQARQLMPEAPEILNTLAYIQLLFGEYEQGWQNYESRDKVFKPAHDSLPFQRWHGEQLKDEQLIVMSEQGLGDTIQFCRLASLLSARGIDVMIYTERKLAALISTMGRIKIITSFDECLRDPRSVRWVPMMSLPGIMRSRMTENPNPVPYLAADDDRVAKWSRRMGNRGFKIGIAWQPGAPPYLLFPNMRAIPLANFAPLAEIPGVRLISLQKGNGSEQIASVPFRDRVELMGEDFDNGPDAFLDTAAVMMALDLLVTCDTSVAHLAGALARPIFMAIPITPDWRWQLHRDDAPWYPTMRLFRQSTRGEWSDVLARIAGAIRVTMSKPQAPARPLENP